MKFKIGDRVVLTKDFCGAKAGMTGTIKGDRVVEFDNDFNDGHSCNGLTNPKRGHYIDPELLKKIEPSPSFTLVITSKGDHTDAKLIHGKHTDKWVWVDRYKEDEYSEVAAIHAVIDKMFPAGAPVPVEEKPKRFTGKAVFKAEVSDGFTKGCIYEFRSGKTTDNFEDHRPRGYEKFSCCEWRDWFNARFIAIVDREDKT